MKIDENYKKYNGNLEDLISDIDDVHDRYTLLVSDNGVCNIYEPDDIDTVHWEQLVRPVDRFCVKKEKKGVLVDVYLKERKCS